LSARRTRPIRSTPRKPKRRSLPWRLVRAAVVLGVLLGMTGALALAGLFYIYGHDRDLPRITSVMDYHPETVTRILDRRGRLIGEISGQRRTVVPYKAFPKVLVHAVVAAEDADFFKHRGLDYMGMLRAFWANLRAGRFVQGGSTITQQVVKTFFLSPERTIRRKMQEVILARRLENELTKHEILFLYLNQIYLGHGCYGMEEAARYYFRKHVGELTVAESAMLAGLPQSPNRLSPLRHPERAKKRQVYVLGQMARHGFISRAVAEKVAGDSIRVVKRVRPYYNVAPEVTDRVRKDLVARLGEKKLARSGLTVVTTLDAELERVARDAVQWGLRAVDARRGYRKPLARLKGRKLRRRLARLKRRQKKLRDGGRYLAVVTAVKDADRVLEVDLGGASGTVELGDDPRYNPQGHAPSKRFAPGDLIRVRRHGDLYRFEGGPQAALVAMDPRNGDVLAMVGGYRVRPGDFNRAVQARRQPGSAFKPFVYAAALESRKFTAATVVDDAPVVIGGWQPKNFGGQYRGPMRLRQALALSVNSVAAKLIDRVGVEPVRKLARAAGIASKLGHDLSLALGSSEVTPLELATAYCTLANGGNRIQPRMVLRMGKEAEPAATPRRVLSAAADYVLVSMMQSVVQEGTARRARRLRRPVAGKTGTTNQQKDAWFAGFTPRLVVVVWVGFDTPKPMGRGETGGRAALPIWLRFMQRALKGKPRLPFKQPPGVVVQRIDPETGLLTPPGATEVLDEVFIQGTAPTETAIPHDQVDPGTILMGTDD